MTREEAIEIFRLLRCQDTRVEADDYEQALDMAIQALSQEPTVQDKQAESEKYQKAFDDGYANGYAQARFDYEQEPCDDAVSRDEVKEIINDIRDCISVEGYCAILERLKKLPPVTQKSETVTEFADRCRECGARYGKLLKDAISRQAVLDIVNNPLNIRLDEIIKKLPSVNPQPCNDAISREAVIKLAYDMSEIDGEHFTEPCMVVDVEDIQNLPSVTQKSGKWICYNYPAHECVYCSNCKTEYYEDDLYLGGSEFPKYCPNCGAKMVEPQERSDKE